MNNFKNRDSKSKSRISKAKSSAVPLNSVPPPPPSIWTQLLGPNATHISMTDFLKVTKIDPDLKPLDDFSDGYIIRLLPAVIQRLKMWSVHILSPENLNKLQTPRPSPKYSHSSEGGSTRASKPNFAKPALQVHSSAVTLDPGSSSGSRPISRLDIIACLYACSDSLVFQDIIRIIAQFPVALPFIIPDLNSPASSPEFICLGSLLKYIRSKWEVSAVTEETPVTVKHNQLFSSPFKMVVALRLGSQTHGKPGKSTILNQVLTLASGGVFASRSDPGSEHGKPLTLDGTVELCILNQEIASSGLWTEALSSHYASGKDEVLLLANLHGDALNFTDTLEALTSYASAFIVFLMPMSLEKMQESCSNLQKSLGRASKFNKAYPIIYRLVDATEACSNVLVPEEQIQTTNLSSDSVSKVTRGALREAIDSAIGKHAAGVQRKSQRVKHSPELSTPESQDIADLVAKGPSDLKSCLKLQLIDPKVDFINVFSNEYGKNEKLRPVIAKMIKILSLPVQQRMIALAHLDLELSHHTTIASAEVRATLMKLSAKKSSTFSLQAPEQFLRQKHPLDDQISAANKKLARVTFGIEHLYRELGRLYHYLQSLDARSSENPVILGAPVPALVADTMIQGNAIEILDGDALYVSGPWFEAICASITRKYPKLKVFVLSIIGLQSSGKSTLLNALFACKFAVSAGRCTSGLFMRLLFLDDNLAKELGVDAIVVLDTEGLGAPEKMNDPEADRRDRIVATFAMSVSNLTLINVLGESLASLTDILQIVIVTMARLEKAEISTDILMVQHVFERDESKVFQGTKEFSKALKTAVEMTEKLEMDIGIQNSSSLQSLYSRLRNGQILHQFPPFKNGASVNAPPSPQYHESIKSLFNTIQKICRETKCPQEFRQWQDVIVQYWDAVLMQDFSLRFKNINEMQDFIDRGKSIQTAKTAIDKAFKEHRDLLETQLRVSLHGQKTTNVLETDIKSKIQFLPESCPSSCTSCKQAMKLRDELYAKVLGKSCEVETKDTLVKYIKRLREETLQHLVQRVNTLAIERTLVDDLDNLVEGAIKKERDRGNRYEGTKLDKIATNVWESVKNEVFARSSVPSASDRILTDIQLEYERVAGVIENVVNETFIDLGRIYAIDKEQKGSAKKMLESEQVHDLRNQLKNACARTLKGHNKFETGSVQILKDHVNSVLETYQEEYKFTLNPAFKWKAHLFALVHFKKEATIIDDKWNQTNNPSWLLESRKDQYMQRISIRLRSGYGLEAEGRILANDLLKAVQKLGQVQGDEAHERHVAGSGWLIDSENVRLRFLSQLAEKVERGDKRDALDFFSWPEQHIKTWFTCEVDRISKEKGIDVYRETVKKEMRFLLQRIRTEIDFNNLRILLLEFLLQAGISNYVFKMDSFNMTDAEFLMFKQAIVRSMETKKTFRVEQIKIASPSSSPAVMKLLGCTTPCYWCHALCWGAYEHDKNSDNTKRHHTCHQPAGLRGTANKTTQILDASPCDSWPDTTVVFSSKFPEGLDWLKAKEEHFKEWMFTKHHKNMFNDLMKWFFLKLNEDIAKEHNKKPAPDSSLKKHNYDSLDNIYLIINTIKQRIGVHSEENKDE